MGDADDQLENLLFALWGHDPDVLTIMNINGVKCEWSGS